MSLDQRQRLAADLRDYADGCARGGSPLYGYLLEHAAADVEAEGVCWRVLREHATGDLHTKPALQLMAAVHRLVLTNRAPALSRFYPSVGGDGSLAGAWDAFCETVEAHADELLLLTQQPVQTNEVARSAVLVGGFLTLAHETGLPLRLLEVGSSAGLNLRWDAYYYQAGALSWGNATSPIRFVDVYQGAPPPFARQPSVTIAERSGCDLAPLDARSEDDRLTLLSLIWADQPARIARLRAALDIAQAMPVVITRADSVKWIGEQLAAPRPGQATIVFHSIVMPYLSPIQRESFRETLAAAGSRATVEAPLAWLRLEAAGPDAESSVRLTRWPGGVEEQLAVSGFHGQNVRWLAG